MYVSSLLTGVAGYGDPEAPIPATAGTKSKTKPRQREGRRIRKKNAAK